MTQLFAEAFEAAKKHAREAYPLESCGFIVGGAYIRCENVAAHPDTHEADNRDCGCQLCAFEISSKVYRHYLQTGKLQMVVHSHPDGPLFPSRADMESQLQMDLPWAIIATDGDRVGPPLVWGADTPVPPILGREFMHGVTDCYSLIRDTYRLGREELAKQDIDWPFEPIELPEQARDDAWWEAGEDLYMRNFERAGFIEVSDPQPGDVFLLKIRSDQFNHGGLLVGGGMIMHHLPERLSRREPAGIWGRQIEKWLRYKGHADA